jgi:hypothetical protein
LDPLPFAIVWPVGAAVTVLAIRHTRAIPPLLRIALCSLALAATVTPTIIGTHSPWIWPAVAVVLITPFVAHYGVTHALLFGVLPIVAMWALIVVIWLGLRKARTCYFTRR